MRAFAIALAVASVRSLRSGLRSGSVNDESDAATAWTRSKVVDEHQGRSEEQWGKLTDDDIDDLGKRDQLIGKIQIRYA